MAPRPSRKEGKQKGATFTITEGATHAWHRLSECACSMICITPAPDQALTPGNLARGSQRRMSEEVEKEGRTRSVLFPLMTLSLLAILLQPVYVAENDEAPGTETLQKPLTFSLFLGDFEADDNPGRLQQEGSGYGWGLTGGYFLNQHLSVEGEFLFFRREYQLVSDSVLPGTANNNQRYLTLSLSALAKASHRFGRWRPFVGVGAGYYDTDLFVTDPESGLFTTDGAPASVNSIGYQFSLGVSVLVRKSLQLEAGWKTIVVDEDFGAHSNGKVDLGGNLIYLAVRGGGY